MDIDELMSNFRQQQATWPVVQAENDSQHDSLSAHLSRINGGLNKVHEAVQAVGSSQERTDEIVTLLAQKLLDLAGIVEQRVSRDS